MQTLKITINTLSKSNIECIEIISGKGTIQIIILGNGIERSAKKIFKKSSR